MLKNRLASEGSASEHNSATPRPSRRSLNQNPLIPPPARSSVASHPDAQTPTAGAFARADHGTVNVPPAEHLSGLNESTRPPRRGAAKFALLALAAAILIGGGVFAYFNYYAPRRAPLGYIEQLSTFESGSYDLRVGSEVEEGDFALSLAGQLDRRVVDNFKLSSQFAIEAAIELFSIDLAGDLRIVDDQLYVQPSELGVLALFVPGVEAETWYVTDLEEDALSDSFSGQCNEEDQTAINNYFQHEALERLQVSQARRHGWFGAEHDGQRVQHYSGAIDGAAFAQMADDLKERVSEDCAATSETDDLAATRIAYDLWTNRDYDHMEVVITDKDGNVVNLALTTNGYNQPVDIATPADAVPFGELFDGFDLEGALPGSESDVLDFSELRNPFAPTLR